MQQPDGHIFISYSRRDDESMRRIAFFLRDQGFKVWVDNEKLVPGTATWEEGIETALKNAYAVIILLSPDSKESEWVRREITYADQFEKRLFPVLVKGAKDEAIPLRLVTRQYVDLRKDEEAGLNALAAAIRFYIDGKQTLQMKRPDAKREKAAEADPDAPRRGKSAWSWVLPLGIVLTLCLAGAAWFGYRAIASSLAPEPDVSTPAPTAPERAEAPATDLPAETPPPATATFPAPDEFSNYLNDVTVTDVDPFDRANADSWTFINSAVEDGVVVITGNANYPGIFRSQPLSTGEGVVIHFEYSQDAAFEIFLDKGAYGAEDYKRFGVYVEGTRVFVNEYGGGNKDGSGFKGNLSLQPETGYTILIAYLPNAELLTILWNTDDPTQILQYRETMDSSWQDLSLSFYVQAGSGTVQVDDFRQIRFSGGK